MREILRKLCGWKGVEIIEGEVCLDHVHILASILPKMSVSVFMGYLKGKSATIIFQKWGNMKFAYRNREFWCKGYYVDTSTRLTANCPFSGIFRGVNLAFFVPANRSVFVPLKRLISVFGVKRKSVSCFETGFAVGTGVFWSLSCRRITERCPPFDGDCSSGGIWQAKAVFSKSCNFRFKARKMSRSASFETD